MTAAGGSSRPAPGRADGRERSAPMALVVDDEPVVRVVMRRALEASGWRVVEATNGREAIARLREGVEVDVVVSDVVMPEAGGAEVAAYLAGVADGPPILFVSGFTRDALAAREGLPVSAPLLQKPFAPEDLVSAVRQLLDGA